jgi:hypothetical protein
VLKPSFSKKLFSITLLLFSTLSIANATAIFARQFDQTCSSCHVGVPPMLNSNGMTFLRNGLRYSNDDPTIYEKLSSDSNVSMPLSVMLQASYQKNSNNEGLTPSTMLLAAGPLTKELSTFIGTKFTYTAKADSNKSFIRLKGVKAYLQYNLDANQQVIRAGTISIYSHLGNIARSTEVINLTNDADVYISPLSMAGIKPLMGAEYSYQSDEGFIFLVAGGNSRSPNSEDSIAAALQYSNKSSFKASLIYNQFLHTTSAEDRLLYSSGDVLLGERSTLMLPIEFELGDMIINSSVVYETNDRVGTRDYYGWETTVSLALFDTANLRAAYAMDNKQSIAYGISYAHYILDSVLIMTSYSKSDLPELNNQSFMGSVLYIY